jgi:hypothetical protein
MFTIKRFELGDVLKISNVCGDVKCLLLTTGVPIPT